MCITCNNYNSSPEGTTPAKRQSTTSGNYLRETASLSGFQNSQELRQSQKNGHMGPVSQLPFLRNFTGYKET